MEYLSIKEVSEKWGISKRRIQTLCNQNRVVGARRVGNYWAILAEAEKPKVERIKCGNYIQKWQEDL